MHQYVIDFGQLLPDFSGVDADLFIRVPSGLNNLMQLTLPQELLITHVVPDPHLVCPVFVHFRSWLCVEHVLEDVLFVLRDQLVLKLLFRRLDALIRVKHRRSVGRLYHTNNRRISVPLVELALDSLVAFLLLSYIIERSLHADDLIGFQLLLTGAPSVR